jgi:hypothetical protein
MHVELPGADNCIWKLECFSEPVHDRTVHQIARPDVAMGRRGVFFLENPVSCSRAERVHEVLRLPAKERIAFSVADKNGAGDIPGDIGQSESLCSLQEFEGA